MTDVSQGVGWWQASDGLWYEPQTAAVAAPPEPQGAACRICGAHELKPKENEITEKRRVKFGIFWILISIVSLGFGVLLWLMMPRKNVVVSVDRYMQCQECKARQT